MVNVPGTIYLIHFNTPYVGTPSRPGAKVQTASHYLGWATDLETRLDQHANGRGARLMAVIGEAGITWQLARTWPGTRTDERRLHNQKHSSRLCPICQAKKEKHL